MVNITHPQNDGLLYIFNKRICPIPLFKIPIIIGKITVQVQASSIPEEQVYNVEFYLDNKFQSVDSEFPYEWDIDSQLVGRHSLTVMVHGLHGEKESLNNDLIFFITEL